MEDVIFGGTETRNQMGFAQVTLVLDNTEHIFPSMEETEVAVTRRYYRSGESEYYINKQSVRLRDVNELSWTPAWAARAIPSSVRAASTKYCRKERRPPRDL